MKQKLLGYGVPQEVLDTLVILESLPVMTVQESRPDAYRLMILDTETTGVDTAKDEIIELAYVIVEFNAQGELGNVVTSFDQLRQPDLPILNSHIHGITDEDCLGQSIDWGEVAEDVRTCHLAVAHNSNFDRRMLERWCPEFMDVAWACSLKDVDFKKRGISSHKLEYLAYVARFHYSAHRALVDVQATLEVIIRLNLFPELLKAAKTVTYVVYAQGAPFSAKDELKENGYRPLYVNGKFKSWYTVVELDKLEFTVDWLKHVIGCRKVPTCEITSKERYSIREEIS